MRFARLCSVLGVVTLLGITAVPTAFAEQRGGHDGGWQNRGQERGRERGEDRDWRRDRDRDSRFQQPQVITVPVPVPVPAPLAAPVLPGPVLPALNQVLPSGGFLQNPPRFIPLQNNAYALSSPLLFCGADQAGTCQQLAYQLAQITPGWGTTIMNGPQGYGVYLTYQSS